MANSKKRTGAVLKPEGSTTPTSRPVKDLEEKNLECFSAVDLVGVLSVSGRQLGVASVLYGVTIGSVLAFVLTALLIPKTEQTEVFFSNSLNGFMQGANVVDTTKSVSLAGLPSKDDVAAVIKMSVSGPCEHVLWRLQGPMRYMWIPDSNGWVDDDRLSTTIPFSEEVDVWSGGWSQACMGGMSIAFFPLQGRGAVEVIYNVSEPSSADDDRFPGFDSFPPEIRVSVLEATAFRPSESGNAEASFTGSVRHRVGSKVVSVLRQTLDRSGFWEYEIASTVLVQDAFGRVGQTIAKTAQISSADCSDRRPHKMMGSLCTSLAGTSLFRLETTDQTRVIASLPTAGTIAVLGATLGTIAFLLGIAKSMAQICSTWIEAHEEESRRLGMPRVKEPAGGCCCCPDGPESMFLTPLCCGCRIRRLTFFGEIGSSLSQGLIYSLVSFTSEARSLVTSATVLGIMALTLISIFLIAISPRFGCTRRVAIAISVATVPLFLSSSNVLLDILQVIDHDLYTLLLNVSALGFAALVFGNTFMWCGSLPFTPPAPKNANNQDEEQPQDAEAPIPEDEQTRKSKKLARSIASYTASCNIRSAIFCARCCPEACIVRPKPTQTDQQKPLLKEKH